MQVRGGTHVYPVSRSVFQPSARVIYESSFRKFNNFVRSTAYSLFNLSYPILKKRTIIESIIFHMYFTEWVAEYLLILVINYLSLVYFTII